MGTAAAAAEVDWWKEPKFSEDDVKHPFLEESNFKVIYPEYRGEYIKEIWPALKDILSSHYLKIDLDAVQKSITIATTKRTYDPYIIIRARDLVKLITRGAPLQQAQKILQCDTFCDIIKIGGFVSNKERFARRRQRLVGPNGSTLRALELLTGCYICVAGQTVSAIGSWKGLKKVRKIALDCMKNIHPVYALKTLMVEKELSSNENMTEANWDCYVPHFQKKKSKKSKKRVSSTRATSSSGCNILNENLSSLSKKKSK